MIARNMIVLGVAAAAILAYVVPPIYSANEYSSSDQAASSVNSCGNGDGVDGGSAYFTSRYENIRDFTACENLASQVQGEENSVGITGSTG